MRKIETHKVNQANEFIELTVLDEPGAGGSCHDYQVRFRDQEGRFHSTLIQFQNGPLNITGVNGLTHEVLLAILIDRFEHFQAGKYANPDTADALRHVLEARDALKGRTEKRIQRGVEGTAAV